MLYDYRCPNCGKLELRAVLLSERDDQHCSCESPMERLPHYADVLIYEPIAFRESCKNGYTQAIFDIHKSDPDYETVKAKWDKDCVGLAGKREL